MDKANIIAHRPLLKGLLGVYCRKIGAIVILPADDRGKFFLFEGRNGLGLYVLFSGEGIIYKIFPEGKEQMLNASGTNETFGKAVVPTEENHPVSAQELAENNVLFCSQQQFLMRIKKPPPLGLSLLILIARHLRRLATMAENLFLKEALSRLSAYQLFMSRQNSASGNIDLETKNQPASCLGTISENVSLILNRRTEEKLIKANRNMISILNSQALTKLHQGASKPT